MNPAARVQAAIDLLDAVIAAARGQGASADRIAADWFRARRFIGSKDRRAVRDLVWDAIRACGDIPPTGRAALLHYGGREFGKAAQERVAIRKEFEPQAMGMQAAHPFRGLLGNHLPHERPHRGVVESLVDFRKPRDGLR